MKVQDRDVVLAGHTNIKGSSYRSTIDIRLHEILRARPRPGGRGVAPEAILYLALKGEIQPSLS
jgi:hypothetical protein